MTAAMPLANVITAWVAAPPGLRPGAGAGLRADLRADLLADGLGQAQELLPLTGTAVPVLATLLALAVLVAGVVLAPRAMRRPGAGVARARALQAATLAAVTVTATVAALAWINSSLVIVASWRDLLG